MKLKLSTRSSERPQGALALLVARPANVALPAAMLLVAAGLQEPSLLPAALVVLVVLWALTAADEAMKHAHPRSTADAARAPEDPVGDRLRQIEAERERIHDVLAEHDLPLEEIGAEAGELTERARDVARAAQQMIESLARLDRAELERRLERSTARADHSATSSPEQSLSLALSDQIDAAQRLDRQLHAALSLLDCIAASLAAAHAHLVRVSCRPDPSEMRELVGQLTALRYQAATLGEIAA